MSGFVPYAFKTRQAQEHESLCDKMKTVLATYRFRQVVEEYSAEGVDFRHHLYVPETDSLTGMT